jgi:hypothetical protein
MEITTFDSKEIQITAVGFRSNPAGQRLESYPRRMVMDDREYTFESCMRYLVQKGQQLFKLFDVSDGKKQYRLRLDGEDHWTLIGIKNAA